MLNEVPAFGCENVFFNPFTAVYIVKQLLLQTIYALNKEIFQFLGLYLRAVSDQEQVIMVCSRLSAGVLSRLV